MGNPKKTKEVFLDNPFGEGKIYKSGDIGRWTFDGKVQVLGRLDHQIKLHGLRVELGEIENKMTQIEGVTSSVVNKIEVNGREVLCGYYVSSENISENMVKEFLKKFLPPYMVPSYIVKLDKMPYTINRKIDRKALPYPNLEKKESTPKDVDISSLNSSEEKLLQIWKNILHIDNISLDDNFFDIGGDSIAAINMQIEAIKYGLNFEYGDIFNFPTVRQLSHKIPVIEDTSIKNYDYSIINEVLRRNSFANLKHITKVKPGNILLIRWYRISWFSYCL